MSKEVSDELEADLVVLGGGPGGYTAAFRAADLGLSVVLVEKRESLGGVCLNVGCIPSKALLHSVAVMEEARALGNRGVEFASPDINLEQLRSWKDGTVKKLSDGLSGLARRRKVRVITGEGRFTGAHSLEAGSTVIRFDKAIIAVGSRPATLPFLPADSRIMDSTGALALEEIPERLLVIGGGIIGLEMATVYSGLGSSVTVVEVTDGLIPGCDRDLVRPLERRIAKRYESVLTGTRVTGVEALPSGLKVLFESADGTKTEVYDRILVAVGRQPNGGLIDADKAGVSVNEHGFIAVDQHQRTNIPHIFAIGDVVGNPMLAHKATYEAKVAGEVAAGVGAINDAKVIPSVAYTDPEVAWVGLTEEEANSRGLAVEVASFPWMASGRALTMNSGDGLTKIVTDAQTHAILGVGMVGSHAGELIAEAALAIEMGCEPGDVALTIHAHPTLSETFAFASEAFEGTLTELYLGKGK